jgi:hypothetical protein
MKFRAAIGDKSSPKTMIPFDSARHVHQSMPDAGRRGRADLFCFLARLCAYSA